MTSVLEAWSLEYLMVRALAGHPLETWKDRKTAYDEYGINFDGLSFEEIEDADREATSIELAKRLA